MERRFVSTHMRTRTAAGRWLERRDGAGGRVGRFRVELACPGPALAWDCSGIQEGVWKPVSAPDFDGSSLAVNALFVDRDEGHVDRHGRAGHLSLCRREDGSILESRRSVRRLRDGIHEDREGNIWVATSEGIDCFRDTRMISYSMLEGLSANQVGSVLAARDGTVWVGNQGALEAIRGHQRVFHQAAQGCRGVSVTSLLEDHAGRLWVGVDSGLSVYEQGRFRPITRRDGTPPGPIFAMIEDRANNIWGIALGTPRRLLRIADFSVREEIPAPQLPSAAIAGGRSRGWHLAGSGQRQSGAIPAGPPGDVSFPGGRHWSGRDRPRRRVRQVVATSDGTVLGARMDGLIAWRNGTLRTLTIGTVFPAAASTRSSSIRRARCGSTPNAVC